MKVSSIATSVSAVGNRADEAADHLGLAPRLVRAAVEYYAEFEDEVNEDAAVAKRFEDKERPVVTPAARPGVKLKFDHYYSTTIAIQLQRRGHDAAVAVMEQGWEAEADECFLTLCEADQSVLGGFRWSSQHLETEVVRDGQQVSAPAGDSRDAREDPVAGPAVDGSP